MSIVEGSFLFVDDIIHACVRFAKTKKTVIMACIEDFISGRVEGCKGELI